MPPKALRLVGNAHAPDVPEPASTSRLLDLPWKLRRRIIIHVLRREPSYLRRGRSNPPSFNREFIKSRLRLRNCFDDKFPELTNFYIPRLKNCSLRSPGASLRATNHQLRRETDQMIERQLKSRNIEELFVLDVMLVKDIGVFPTWMSFPYRPTHLKKLTVNIRIVRPGTSAVPNEWVDVARYNEEDNHYPTSWHLLMAITFYAFGCFSLKQDPMLPRGRQGDPAASQQAQHAKTKQANGNKKTGKQFSPGVPPNLVNHTSGTLDAYRLPSASYITDELLLRFDQFEYDTNNKRIPLPARTRSDGPSPCDPIPPGAIETRKESRFYKQGCVQFSREFFVDYSTKYMEMDEIVEDLRLMYEGRYLAHDLQEVLTDIIYKVRSPAVHESTLAPYFQILAHSVGVLNHTGPRTPPYPLFDRYPSDWTNYYEERREDDVQAGEWAYSDHVMARNLARELAREPPDEGYIVMLRIAQSRKSHGCILECDP